MENQNMNIALFNIASDIVKSSSVHGEWSGKHLEFTKAIIEVYKQLKSKI